MWTQRPPDKADNKTINELYDRGGLVSVFRKRWKDKKYNKGVIK